MQNSFPPQPFFSTAYAGSYTLLCFSVMGVMYSCHHTQVILVMARAYRLLAGSNTQKQAPLVALSFQTNHFASLWLRCDFYTSKHSQRPSNHLRQHLKPFVIVLSRLFAHTKRRRTSERKEWGHRVFNVCDTSL